MEKKDYEYFYGQQSDQFSFFRIVCTLDFHVTPHQLRHTYVTNLIAAGVDPKTVQYLAGHKNSKVTMDIYARVKYNRPEQISGLVNSTFSRKNDSCVKE